MRFALSNSLGIKIVHKKHRITYHQKNDFFIKVSYFYKKNPLKSGLGI